jgi:hypothetical protein
MVWTGEPRVWQMLGFTAAASHQTSYSFAFEFPLKIVPSFITLS